MIKLIRALRSEQIKHWGAVSSLGMLALAFVLAFALSLCCALIAGEPSLSLPAFMTEGDAGRVFANDELAFIDTLMEKDRLESQKGAQAQSSYTISQSDISQSDISQSDIAQGGYSSDKIWRDYYYEQLVLLEQQVDVLELEAKVETGARSSSAAIEAQRLIREAIILNTCMNENVERNVSVAWYTVILVLKLMLIPAGIMCACAAAQCFAQEYTLGTYRTVLPLPATRFKVWCAKLLTQWLWALLLMLCVFAGALIGCAVGYGSLGTMGDYVGALGSKGYVVPWSVHALHVMLGCFGTLVILIALCAFAANLCRSSAACVATGAVTIVCALTLGSLAGSLDVPVLSATLLCCLDLSAPLTGLPNCPTVSYIASYLSAFLHLIALLICGYLPMRKDI